MIEPAPVPLPLSCHRRRGWPTVFLLACAGVCWSTRARSAPAAAEAQEPNVERFDLHYTAPADCPDQQAFLSWTNRFYFGDDQSTGDAEGRPSRATWQAAEDDLAGSVRVKVVRSDGQFVAQLVMVNADGRCPASRPPHSETNCADAVRAMAYSLAEALKAPACEAEATPPALERCPPPIPIAVRRPPICEAPKPRPIRSQTIHGEVGVGVGRLEPLAEGVGWGGALLVGFRGPRGSASARASVGYWDAGAVPMGYGLRAQLWSLGVSACPFEFSLGNALTIPLCATAELGQVALSGFGSTAQGGAPADPLDGTPEQGDRANLYLWSALGVALRVRLSSRWLFAEFEPNLIFPLLRHPVYGHQPSSETSDKLLLGQVGRWYAGRAMVNVGVVF